ncbi:hypothetical protein KDH_07560 [Dictyobacter sp. S3.2.2.5]|uniref:Uncharacterized protein n=1 Tax=Dictyobacter halimunensis TaxID=3026934 RepID=A0ABQ6FLM3_9CHLR|nr:hypothetical protein KDH_07560 [Dictyobacter sp. S3.2.2.5]
MDNSTSTPEERFALIVGELLNEPGVTPPTPGRAFGSSGLKVHQKIFAMLAQEKLVVKLPKTRIDELVASGAGERYDPRHNGRVMKEWITIDPGSSVDWLPLAQEALEFVGRKP